MKKFLALVLALVMTMSLVTISAGAEFTDADSVTYDEAVEVMTAVGVVGGYADGSFNPTAGLTRGAAAKIICNMILGPTTAEALSANDAPFSDVAVDNVFAGYIAYCANEGIISGYADGTFKPAAPLTGYAFMKMLLGALGYDAAIEGYVGSNWSIAVAKRALNIGLDDGLVGDFSGAKALTREEACLYAFNAMNASMVQYDNKSTITIGDVVIAQNSEAKVVAAGEDGLFRSQYFKKLDKVAAGTPSVDAFGRPAYTWMNGKDEIGTYADAADYVVVLDDTYANEAELTEAVQDLTGNNKLVAKTGAATYVNGDPSVNYDASVYGTVVELFCNDDDNANLITSVVGYYYTVDKIVAVDDDVTKADAKKDVTCYVEFDNAGEYNDIDVVGFDAETYVKDAYVALIVNGDGEIIDSFIPEVAEGSLTTVKGNDYVTMDGTKYYAVAALGLDFSGLKTGADNTYKLFLDANGNVIGTKVVDEAAAEIDEVYYVALAWDEDANKYNESGKKAYFAQLVAMDGTISEVELEKDYSALAGKLVTMTDKKYTESGVTYKADNDKFDLKAWSNADFDVLTVGSYSGWTFKKDMTRFTLGNGTTFRFNDKTVYVLVENTGRDLDASVKVGGIALAGTSAMKGFVITADDSSVAQYVVIANPSADIDETNTFDAENLVYIKALSAEKGEGYRVQTVYGVDGKETTLKVDEDEYTDLDAGKFYAVDTNDDGFYVLSADASDVKVLDVEAANNVWDDEEGVLVGVKYVGMFETLLSVEGAVDVETADAAFADLHDTEVGYAKTVKTLSALKALYDKEGYTTEATLALNVTEDGAVTIFVTALTHGKTPVNPQ
jgi:hypothetical protein